MSAPKTIHLADYKKPDFVTDRVELEFDIQKDHTVVTSQVKYKRAAEGLGATTLILDAENPNKAGRPYVRAVTINGKPAQAPADYIYDESDNKLIIPVAATDQEIDVRIETFLEPQDNSALSGLYQSDKVIVTQCESQGFRRITPFLDRPDVMARYTVKITADEADCPVLLSNGNKVSSGRDGQGRHWAVYDDPFPKPSYLFATANGALEALEDVFVTKSGRKVNIRVFTDPGETAKGRHALESVKKSMKWDEDVFDCEYDLDDFNVVTIAKFNMGAMENKGLNVFRDSLVLALPDIATDANYQRITDIIGHEYFHNWSGDRVTLANWFNLSLKEGLTVIREQMFTAFTTSPASQRISAVQYLRTAQFPEDDSPLAHPVMPQDIQSVENIYTSTVYQKGAEVIRMMKVLMGEEKFIEGVKHYFKTYDGQAVTIAEFRKSMEAVSGLNLSGQFSLWYTQSGRPRVKATGVYDPAAKTYTLNLEQIVTPTKKEPVKQPMYIPVQMGLVNAKGKDIPLILDGDTPGDVESGKTERVLHFTKEKQSFVFHHVAEKPAFHSLFRGFSAPVDCDPGLNSIQLRKQLLTDTDGFNRWDAAQKLYMHELKRIYKTYEASGNMPALTRSFTSMIHNLVQDTQTDPALLALLLTMPSVKEREAAVQPVRPSSIAAVRDHVRKSLARAFRQDFVNMFNRVHGHEPYSFDYGSVGRRDLKRRAVGFLMAEPDSYALDSMRKLYLEADSAQNMTDRIIAMGGLCDHASPEREEVFKSFYQRFKGDNLTIQKWFSLQALSEMKDLIPHLNSIAGSGVFDPSNPGHVGSLFSAFAANYAEFHKPDGSGYRFVADKAIEIDKLNSTSAARLAASLANWRNYTADHRKLMVEQLDRLAAIPTLSVNVREKVFKSLPDEAERLALNSGQIAARRSGPKPG